MAKKYFADIVINKEKLSTGEPIFVAHCISLGIASQGKTTEEAMRNIKEAIALCLEEQPDKYEALEPTETFFSVVEISKHAKAAGIVR
ncbi:MAG TPA: type II toxin-antitoxin system HicB family antitoxin [Candidatus Nanoarchaeia archaeon]|nr:type II toxin-antitoxin system HicB family antitoxin [Candidatus Nanoarchaeia archaeon]